METKKARSRTLRLEVWGDNACFTRPEMKVERVSYDVMTPSAARGVLEAILWKPAIVWRVEQIDVLKKIKWESVRRNEVGAVASKQSKGIFIEDDRQQRAGLFLRDVRYVIHSHFEMTEKAEEKDNVIKFEEMFLRRAEKGQCFNTPYLGCREFSASFAPLAGDLPTPEPIDDDLGWMLYDIDFSGKEPTPKFFRAKLVSGSLMVPPHDSKEVKG